MKQSLNVSISARFFFCFLFMGLLMLVNSCSSTDEWGNEVPPFVGTRLAMSVSSASQPSGRMSDGWMQEEAPFTGMKSLYLFPFAGASDKLPSGQKLASMYALPPFTEMEHNGADYKVKIPMKVQLPLGTDHVLFYAAAVPPKGAEDEGVLIPSFSSWTEGVQMHTVNDIRFSLQPIYSTEAQVKARTFGDEQAKILRALNALDEALKPFHHEGAKKIQSEFSTLISGSALSVKLAVRDMLNAMRNLKEWPAEDLQYRSGLESVAKNYFTFGPQLDNAAWDWNASAPELIRDISWKAGAGPSEDYPKSYGLPYGAVLLKYVPGANAPFEYASPNQPLGDYVKPAPLCYHIESRLRATDRQLIDHWSGKPWPEVVGEFSQPRIETNSNEAIIVSPVQFAVAKLATDVRLQNAEIKDSRGMTVSSPSRPRSFRFCGILIGQQCDVDWTFTSVTKSEAAAQRAVYDPVSKTDAQNWQVTHKGLLYQDKPKSYPTLVLENRPKPDDVVNIAVELYNGGPAFSGKNGQLIPEGSYFYLFGKLSLPESAAPLDRVFMKDHVTVLKLTVNSLANAYNTVPDMRIPEVNMDLTVNWEWQHGWTPDYDIP